MKQRLNFISVLKEQIHNVPIREVIYTIYENPRGRCLFHRDKTPGSFSLNATKNTYRCWSCGAYGDAISYVQYVEKIEFVPAVLKLAVLLGIIQQQDIKAYYKELFDTIEVKPLEFNYIETTSAQRASTTERDNVYRHMQQLSYRQALLKHHSLLDKAHLEHLKMRGFTLNEIKCMDVFSMLPRNQAIKTELFNAAKRDSYEGIPGFYYDEEKQQFTFAAKPALCIGIKNLKNEIVALQLRKNTIKKDEQRYTWFSSGFVNGNEGFSKGTGSGSPTHVSVPLLNEDKRKVFITEGFFKAEAIRFRLGYTALSIQGVNQSVDGICEILDDMPYIEEIIFAFDKDITENGFVFLALENLYHELQKRYPLLHFRMMYWTTPQFKGIDDLLLEEQESELQWLDITSFISLYRSCLENLMTVSGHGSLQELLQETSKAIIADYLREKVLPYLTLRPVFH